MKNLDGWWNSLWALFWPRVRPARAETEEGQGLVEYALVLLFVVIVVVVILVYLGPQLGSMFSAVTKGFS